MPYINTMRLPRAHRFIQRGMGAASCPSSQQLLGVVDPADPCQQTAPSGDTYVFPQIGATQAAPACMPGDVSVALPTGGYGCTTPAAPGSALSMSAWLQANPIALVGLGAAVLVLLAPLAGGRR